MTHTTLHLTRTIDASHVIPDHPGKCGRLHGHTYRFEVWLSGPVAAGSDMLVDFFDIKATIDAWDHQHLNDMVDYTPTAELLAADMQQRLRPLVIAAAAIDGDTATIGCVVRLWETPNAYAEVGELTTASGTPVALAAAAASVAAGR
ncbi:MAG: 6-carboxytetrahydropterin synthase [Thermoleophilia bacterium]|nr:6-carboxytetrahydropterin synthase [Thermoleophilia bacterium]